MQLSTHLNFNGQCEAAFKFYEKVLGGKITFRMTFKHEDLTDEVLIDRVRSKIGRVVSHAGAVEVAATDGRVTLSGPVLVSEADKLMRGVRLVRGVKDVENQLEVHEQAGDIPALQGPRAVAAG